MYAALDLIVERELHAVKMSDIASRAGVGIGTIYKYFKNKEDIVCQLWIFQKKHEADFILSSYSGRGSIRERFDSLWRKVIEYFITFQKEYYFSYHYAASPIITEEIHLIAMSRFLVFDKVFEDGILSDIFIHGLTARELRKYTFSTINGWILWSLSDEVDFSSDRIKLYLDMAWNAITLR